MSQISQGEIEEIASEFVYSHEFPRRDKYLFVVIHMLDFRSFVKNYCFLITPWFLFWCLNSPEEINIYIMDEKKQNMHVISKLMHLVILQGSKFVHVSLLFSSLSCWMIQFPGWLQKLRYMSTDFSRICWNEFCGVNCAKICCLLDLKRRWAFSWEIC